VVTVDGISWDGNGHSRVRNGIRHGVIVARLFKNSNHTHTNDGIWSVEVMGVNKEKSFRHARDAQNYAAAELNG
jgi:hypothetical protein